MKTLKIIGMLLLLVSFMACKKDKIAPQLEPEPIEEPFDIKQYVLVEWDKVLSFTHKPVPVINTFEPQSKSTSYSAILGPGTNISYSYNNGVLKHDGREFKIENKTISRIGHADPSYTCQLVKIPANNQLDGNTYMGSWTPVGSMLMSISNLKFTDTHYDEQSFINLLEPNKQYTLIKNIGAFYGNNITRTLLVLVDGKLEGHRYNNGNESIGAFTKK